MKTQQFTAATCKETRTYLEEKFNEIFEETGIKFSIGNIKFDNDSFTTTLQATIGGDDNKKEWDKHCYKFGLQKEWFGETFTLGNKTYEICGIKKYASDRSVVASYEGKKYLFRHLDVIPTFLTKKDHFTIK
jgi:hypothetical protein